eukprot:1394795-Rhodomonas_salina.3
MRWPLAPGGTPVTGTRVVPDHWQHPAHSTVRISVNRCDSTEIPAFLPGCPRYLGTPRYPGTYMPTRKVEMEFWSPWRENEWF